LAASAGAGGKRSGVGEHRPWPAVQPGSRRKHHGGGPWTSCLEGDRGNLAAVCRHASLTPAGRLGLATHCRARIVRQWCRG